MVWKKTDLIGKKFGKLTVIKDMGKNSYRKYNWLCQCECGNTTVVTGTSLNKENGTKSCGCLSKKHFKDLTGQKFNRLNIIKYLGKNKTNNNIYLADCDCGKQTVQEGSDMSTGKVRSCGCLKGLLNRNDDALERSIYTSYKSAAKRRGYTFSLHIEDFKVIIKQPCFYCGIEHSNHVERKYTDSVITLDYNGIDRIDNTEGYNINNVTSCCNICNQAKHTMPQDKFIDWVKRISNNLKNK